MRNWECTHIARANPAILVITLVRLCCTALLACSVRKFDSVYSFMLCDSKIKQSLDLLL